jgi:putative Mg2+ transporter-C (MgtC) family protein
MEWQAELRILLDITIATALGGVLGFEREKKDKPAGFRTNMLIAGGAALLLALGREIAIQMQQFLPSESLGVDPTRIVHAIIVGVSFIGAGTIIKSQDDEKIHYLTTAATILFSAGVGISVGLQLYVVAVGVTILGLIVNFLVGKIYG